MMKSSIYPRSPHGYDRPTYIYQAQWGVKFNRCDVCSQYSFTSPNVFSLNSYVIETNVTSPLFSSHTKGMKGLAGWMDAIMVLITSPSPNVSYRNTTSILSNSKVSWGPIFCLGWPNPYSCKIGTSWGNQFTVALCSKNPINGGLYASRHLNPCLLDGLRYKGFPSLVDFLRFWGEGGVVT